MSEWPSTRARQVLAALIKIGWQVKRQTGSHKTLARSDWPNFVFAFHDAEEIGPRMLAPELPRKQAFALGIFDRSPNWPLQLTGAARDGL